MEQSSDPAPSSNISSRTPKLLDRVREAIRTKHYSRRTESAYVDWIRRYIVFHGKRHPSEMGALEIASFLTWLATNRRVSASTQNQALSAVLFMYRDVLHLEIGAIEHLPRARMPVRMPVVLSRDEVARIMKHLDRVAWLIVAFLYGAGLRLQECLELRVKDIDLEGRQIRPSGPFLEIGDIPRDVRVLSYSQSFLNPVVKATQNLLAFFVEDAVRLRSDIVVTAGLRWPRATNPS